MFHVKPHDVKGALSEQIQLAITAAGLSLDATQVRMLVRHAELVLEANEHVNLTRIVEPQAVAVRHVVDSLVPYSLVGSPDGSFVDIGSGAGYPGIPWLILTGAQGTLCESVGKKAKFLERCVAELALNGSVYAGRAEELAAVRGAEADVVVARAVSTLGALVELASPLLREGGRLIALKGQPSADEIEHAKQTAEMCGMMQQAVYEFRLPIMNEPRTVFTYLRSGSPAVKLPRRVGLAQKHPLAG